MAEWLKAHAWKACKQVTVSGVRIPLSPPFCDSRKLAGIYKNPKHKIRLVGQF